MENCKRMRNNRVIISLIEILKEIAIEEKAYKIVLDCADQVKPFYEKVVKGLKKLMCSLDFPILETQ